MKLVVLDEETYLKYALKSPYISIYQLPEWGTLKTINGWKRHLIGVYNDKSLIGVTMLLEKQTPIKKSLFYSPRGYLTKVTDYKVLQEFHNLVIDYIKSNNGFMLKVDPNVIYSIRDSEGNIVKDSGKNIYFNFKKLGFKHLGFTQNFENLQPRYLCRFKLANNYQDTFKTFTKTTQKNITKTYDMGVRVRKINVDEIDLFVSLLQNTADMKGFVIRPKEYYEKMFTLMSDYINLYISYIDTSLYYEYIYNSLESTKKELVNLEKQMTKINVGTKMKRKHDELTKKITSLEDKLKNAKDMKKSSKEISIGALMSVFVGNEGTTFMSGTNNSYKDFNPKYAFYNEHIKESLNRGMEYVNFYGISGNMDKSGPYYGIYELKKGFNPEIIELLGEFDYIINPIYYYAYKIALKAYKLIK